MYSWDEFNYVGIRYCLDLIESDDYKLNYKIIVDGIQYTNFLKGFVFTIFMKF